MTKEYLIGQIQATEAALVLLDTGLVLSHPTPEWVKALRRDLANNLVHYRRLLDELPQEPVIRDETWFKGFLDGHAMGPGDKGELFDLLLADEKRKAYDEGKVDGRLEGYAKGYEVGHDRGYNKLEWDNDPPSSWQE